MVYKNDCIDPTQTFEIGSSNRSDKRSYNRRELTFLDEKWNVLICTCNIYLNMRMHIAFKDGCYPSFSKKGSVGPLPIAWKRWYGVISLLSVRNSGLKGNLPLNCKKKICKILWAKVLKILSEA